MLTARVRLCLPSLCLSQDLNQEVTLEEFVKMMTPRMVKTQATDCLRACVLNERWSSDVGGSSVCSLCRCFSACVCSCAGRS